MARGEQGEIFRLDGPSGSFAVKRLFEARHEDDVRASADLQDAAAAAGVATPRTIRTADGAVLVDWQWRAYEWVDLGEPDPTIDPAAVGALVGAIHRLAVPADGEQHWWYTEPVGAPRWDALLADLAAQGAPFAPALGALRDELVALEGLMTPATVLQQCHLDLWADNLCPTPAGGVCVIDWDNAGPGDPSRELALVLYEFAYRSPARARSLHDAYVDAGGTGRITGRADFSMVIAQLGHITEMACQHWLDPARTRPRSHHELRVGELTDRPLTRAVIDELVDAVG